MGYSEHAFVSYAHLDNVELVEGRKGWVTNLHRALEVRVGQLLGRPPQIWRDPKLAGNDLFADTLIERLRSVAVLVSVVSPRYIQSEWALRELREFWRTAEAHGGIHVRNRARVFKILKTPVHLDRTPPELRALIGYEFFKVDPETGKVRELDEVFGPEAQRDFWIRLDDLAHDICELLEAMEDPERASRGVPPSTQTIAVATPQSAAQGEAVYLAESTSDLKESREALRRDLQQHGYTVLPQQTLPHVIEDTRAAVREALSHCRMSIHPIGKHYSLVPEGGPESLVELQYELATERALQGGLSRLLWIPSGITVEDERQRHVVERLRRDPRLAGNADLLETPFEDLRSLMHEWLARSQTPAAPAPAASSGGHLPHLYVVADPRDAEVITPWVDALFERDLEVTRPIFDGDEAEIREYHEENLAACDGLLIFYGAGNELWVRRKLREVQKAAGHGRTAPPPVVGICLVGERTAEKERFRTHEAIVVPQWNGVELDALTAFIARLKGRGPV
jgi:hypothetical protein